MRPLYAVYGGTTKMNAFLWDPINRVWHMLLNDKEQQNIPEIFVLQGLAPYDDTISLAKHIFCT